MSLELHVLVMKERLPDRGSWQQAIEKLLLPMVLDPTLKVPSASGFVPCTLDGAESGFELYWDSAPDLIACLARLQSVGRSLILAYVGRVHASTCFLDSATVHDHRFFRSARS